MTKIKWLKKQRCGLEYDPSGWWVNEGQVVKDGHGSSGGMYSECRANGCGRIWKARRKLWEHLVEKDSNTGSREVGMKLEKKEPEPVSMQLFKNVNHCGSNYHESQCSMQKSRDKNKCQYQTTCPLSLWGLMQAALIPPLKIKPTHFLPERSPTPVLVFGCLLWKLQCDAHSSASCSSAFSQVYHCSSSLSHWQRSDTNSLHHGRLQRRLTISVWGKKKKKEISETSFEMKYGITICLEGCKSMSHLC